MFGILIGKKMNPDTILNRDYVKIIHSKQESYAMTTENIQNEDNEDESDNENDNESESDDEESDDESEDDNEDENEVEHKRSKVA